MKALVSSGLFKMAFTVTCDVGTLQERYACRYPILVHAHAHASLCDIVDSDHKIAGFNHTHLYLYLFMVSIMEDGEDSQFYRNMTRLFKNERDGVTMD